MDVQQMSIILGVFGLAQSVVVAALWCIVYYHTKHRGGWFLVALLPIAGTLVVPVVGALALSAFASSANGVFTFQLVTGLLSFLCAVIPLFILALRFMNGVVQVRDAADVFDDPHDRMAL